VYVDLDVDVVLDVVVVMDELARVQDHDSDYD
jgi:hypothetical protein